MIHTLVTHNATIQKRLPSLLNKMAKRAKTENNLNRCLELLNQNKEKFK